MTLSKHDRARQALVSSLYHAGIRDSRVLAALRQVPREEFVPAEFRSAAYGNFPLAIGHGQTISQPYTVAVMCEALELEGSEKVLEIGTGSGYGAAILSLLAREVFSVERIEALAEGARQRLSARGSTNVTVLTGDGSFGLAREAPFDAIVVTAAAPRLPRAYVTQLSDGGRIVIPVGSRGAQKLWKLTKQGEKLHAKNLGWFSFVPLLGGAGVDPTERGVRRVSTRAVRYRNHGQ